MEDAHLNAQLNGISNATFMLGDLQDLKLLKQSNATGSAPASAPDAATATSAAAATATATVSSPAASASAKLRMLQPDVVVVDPARAGLSQAVVSFLQGCGARRVVYVSCNPATQVIGLQHWTTQSLVCTLL